MQIINVLNKAEFDQFKKGGMIQIMGVNPMIAYDSGGRVLRASTGQLNGHPERAQLRPGSGAPNGKSYACVKCGKMMPSRQSLGGHLASRARAKNKRKLLAHANSGA